MGRKRVDKGNLSEYFRMYSFVDSGKRSIKNLYICEEDDGEIYMEHGIGHTTRYRCLKPEITRGRIIKVISGNSFTLVDWDLTDSTILFTRQAIGRYGKYYSLRLENCIFANTKIVYGDVTTSGENSDVIIANGRSGLNGDSGKELTVEGNGIRGWGFGVYGFEGAVAINNLRLFLRLEIERVKYLDLYRTYTREFKIDQENLLEYTETGTHMWMGKPLRRPADETKELLRRERDSWKKLALGAYPEYKYINDITVIKDEED